MASKNTEAGHRAIGVDVGGTKVAVARIDGTVLSEPQTFPTDLGNTGELLDQFAEVIRAQGEAEAVGIGVPSVIDVKTGAARRSVRVPLQNVPLREELSKRLDGMPVVVGNDASVAALSEAYDDELRLVADSLVMFTIGTGVGGGIVLGGRIYNGATGAAGEVGHQIIDARFGDGGPFHEDKAPQPGTIERLASGSALGELGNERGFEDGRAVVKAARAGDEKALEAVRILGTRIGVAVSGAINTFDPEQIVIGGGVSDEGDLLLDTIKETAARFVLPGVGTETEIRLARLAGRAGVRGAALLAVNHLDDR